MANAAVHVWHCDQQGRYSLYSQGAESENYLRGVQAAGTDGIVTFDSIFPACYSGRWPHVHFEVYRSYEQSVSNLRQVSLDRDMVFSDDGGVHELGTIGGNLSGGLNVQLAVPVMA